MYQGLVQWHRDHMLDRECPLASPGDMDIPTCVSDGPSILKVIREHRARWKQQHDKRQGKSR
jgi:hypothetical protein